MRVPKVYKTSGFILFLLPIVYIGIHDAGSQGVKGVQFLHIVCAFYHYIGLCVWHPTHSRTIWCTLPGYIGCQTAFCDISHYIIQYSIHRLTRLTPHALSNNMMHAPEVYRVSDFILWCIALYHMSDTLRTSGSLHRCVGCWDCNRCDMYGIPHTDSDTQHKCVPTKKSLLPLWNQSCRHTTRHKMARLSSKRRSFFSPLVLPIYNYL